MRASQEMSHFAQTILNGKYAHTKPSGHKESWPEIAHRVTYSVMKSADVSRIERVREFIEARKIMPGGRYLYAAGRRYPQINNCFLFIAEDSREGWADTMHKNTSSLMTGGGVGNVYSKLRPKGALVGGMGGTSTGPCALMQMVNESGRHIMQGGSRRCLPFNSLVHCKRGLVRISDVEAGDEVLTGDGYRKVNAKINSGKQDTVVVLTQLGELECTPNHRLAVLVNPAGEYIWKQAKDLVKDDRLVFIQESIPGQKTQLPDQDVSPKSKFSSTCQEINIPILDEEMAWFLGFLAGDGNIKLTDKGTKGCVKLTCGDHEITNQDRCLAGLRRFGVRAYLRPGDGLCKDAMASSAKLAKYLGKFKKAYQPLSVPECIKHGSLDIRAAYVAGIMDADGCPKTRPISICNSVYKTYLVELQSICASLGFATSVKLKRPARGNWQALYTINVLSKGQLKKFKQLVVPYSSNKELLEQLCNSRKMNQFSYTMPVGMVITAGLMNKLRGKHHNTKADVTSDTMLACGISMGNRLPIKVVAIREGRNVDTYDLEVEDRHEFVTNGMLVHNSAIWAGLHWWHPDIFEFINLKNWSPEVQELKRKDFNFPAPMDGTNISVCLDGEFFLAIDDENHPKHLWAQDVYWAVIPQMCRTGEPGFSVDVGLKELEWARNACTEVSSPDDSDMCNLVSLNMARFGSIEEFEDATDAAAELMLYGTLYSPLPLERMHKIREKNRRLGLGLMGIHEWLLRRGKRYGPDKELGKWLEVYASVHQKAADHADKMGISRPVGTRAIAPTGTIAIVAETTSGIEPIFAVALKRRYLNQDMTNTWKYQYIIDACAQRVIDAGVDPELIEDAYDLAEDYERRIQFQAWTQKYVDHGISSTINMPAWGTSVNNKHTLEKFGRTLLNYLPGMRGITVYPDGARGGQPLNRVPYTEAVRFLGQEFVEGGEVSAVIQEFGNERSCVNGLCGI